jgi:hypothetical protein
MTSCLSAATNSNRMAAGSARLGLSAWHEGQHGEGSRAAAASKVEGAARELAGKVPETLAVGMALLTASARGRRPMV